jgi:hypothetical protein
MSEKSYSYDPESNTVQMYDGSYDNQIDFRSSDFLKEVGSVRVSSEGVERLGVNQYQSFDHNPQSIRYYTENGGRQIDVSEANDSSVVDIPGFGRTTFGAGNSAGLIVQQSGGTPEQTVKKNSDVETEESTFQGFETPEVTAALSGLQQIMGSREGVHSVVNSTIAKLSLGNTEDAVKDFASQTGLEVATAGEAVEDIYSNYQSEANRYVKTLGVDPDAVGDFFNGLDSTAQSHVMRNIFLGNGKQVLTELVNMFKKSQQ